MRIVLVGVLAALLAVPAAQADSVAATKQLVRTWSDA